MGSCPWRPCAVSSPPRPLPSAAALVAFCAGPCTVSPLAPPSRPPIPPESAPTIPESATWSALLSRVARPCAARYRAVKSRAVASSAKLRAGCRSSTYATPSRLSQPTKRAVACTRPKPRGRCQLVLASRNRAEQIATQRQLQQHAHLPWHRALAPCVLWLRAWERNVHHVRCTCSLAQKGAKQQA